MTQALDSLPLGHWVDFKGPVGKFEYLGKGRCSIGGCERRVRRFVMVCAGSGITPVFPVPRAVMKDRDDPTACLLLDGNRGEDILCRMDLEASAARDAARCELVFALSRPGSDWKGVKGRMNKALFQKRVGGPPTGRDTLVLVCGPAALERRVPGIFTAMGWSDVDFFFF